ncbi:hypothetical protein LTR62_003208 [Meristemomyces frigidus]|uniref:Uncharacterized protein n=1 Tax=Meristemomyces frigidus TaxID=1508187 RepID=A0AAN7YPW7_9PEZI|nr:hypothetical protein LTR62_003208 [Meristemomyces frigidus]
MAEGQEEKSNVDYGRVDRETPRVMVLHPHSVSSTSAMEKECIDMHSDDGQREPPKQSTPLGVNENIFLNACNCATTTAFQSTSVHNTHSPTQSNPTVQSSTDDRSPQRPIPVPALPPFLPPDRIKTPDGLPRWPGELDDTDRTPRAGQVGVRGYLRQRSLSQIRLHELYRVLVQTGRGRVSEVGGHYGDERTGRRFWRPPVSGYLTSRYGDLETHPFVDAPFMVPVARRGSPMRVQQMEEEVSGVRRMSSTEREEFLLHQRRAEQMLNAESGSAVPQSSTRRVLSPLERSLHAATGNAVPVTPERASKAAVASANGRSVPLPRTWLQQSGSTNVARNSSIRTTDLLSQFPAPRQSKSQIPGKRPAWSLFPRQLAASSLQENAEPSAQGSLDRNGPFRERLRRVVSGPLSRKYAEHERILSPTPTRPSRLSCTFELAELPATGPSALTTPAVSHQGLWRCSGSAVYELEGTSLPSQRHQGERGEEAVLEGEHNGVEIGNVDSLAMRPGTALTGTSRYFSAASVALATAHNRDEPSAMTVSTTSDLEQNRGTANGNVGLVTTLSQGQATVSRVCEEMTGPSQTSGPSTYSTTIAEAIPRLHIENMRQRGTRAQAVRQKSSGASCKHSKCGLGQRTRSPTTFTLQQLDGHGRDTDLPSTPLDPTTTRSTPQLVSPASHETVNTTHTTRTGHDSCGRDGRTIHVSHLRRAKGTWRTRMQRTRCWRCALHESGLKGWKRLRRMAEWTCFRCYRAYDDEEEEEVEGQMAALASGG